jgi:DNA invertase Pin-like site-specific DNA recombinase
MLIKSPFHKMCNVKIRQLLQASTHKRNKKFQVGLEAQKVQFKIIWREIEPIAEFTDNESGTSKSDRQGFERCNSILRKANETYYYAKLDRLNQKCFLLSLSVENDRFANLRPTTNRFGTYFSALARQGLSL